jgi:hypothetical protein
MRYRIALVCVAATVAAPLVSMPAAHAACVGTSRTMNGTIQGADRRYVGTMLGFDAIDSAGRKIDARPGSSTYGCVFGGAYSTTVRVNFDLPATGSTTTGTYLWKVTLPTNVTHTYIEAYASGPRYEGTNQTRYGNSMRRKIPVPYPATIHIALPLVCAAGGTTGAINGYTTLRGVRAKADRVAAWSMGTDNNGNNPILGWNVGASADNGYYKIDNLQSGQTYTVRISKNGVTKQFYNVRVDKCHNTYLGAAF